MSSHLPPRSSLRRADALRRSGSLGRLRRACARRHLGGGSGRGRGGCGGGG